MKKTKLNISFLTAILIAGLTFTTQANFFGRRLITRCFTEISLKNANGSLTATLKATPPLGCLVAKAQVVSTQYVTAANLATSLPDESTCTIDEVFCCAKVTEIMPSDPGYANAPFINLGEGPKKYKIASSDDVFCKALILR